jgi:hypothetical protein
MEIDVNALQLLEEQEPELGLVPCKPSCLITVCGCTGG